MVSLTHIGAITGAGAPNYLGEAAGLAVDGDYAYIGCASDDSLTIIDISNVRNPVFKGYITGAGAPNYLDGIYFLVKDDKYIYASANTDNALVIIDVSNPTNPVLKGEIHGSGAPNYLGSVNGLVKDGNYVYITSASNHSLTIINVSNPSTPTFESYLPQAAPDNYLNGIWGIDKKDNYVYVTSRFGISSIDVSNPSSPLLVNTLVTTSKCYGIKISGNYAYVTIGAVDTLYIIDISDPTSLLLKGMLVDHINLDYLFDIKIDSNYAYITCLANNAFTIVNIQDPENPIIESTISGAGSPNYLQYPWGIYYLDSNIYITASNDNALTIFGKPIISGNVKDNKGYNLQEVMIDLIDTTEYSTLTDSSGNYSQVVDPDVYAVTASVTGNGLVPETVSVDASSSDQTQNFILDRTTTGNKGTRLRDRILMR